MQKSKTATRNGNRGEEKDSVDALGVRGAGAAWQADFGMALNEADLLFSVRREPVANRIVFQIAHDVFDNWFRVEEISEKPDPNFDKEVQMVLSELNAKSVFTQMAVFERLFGWAIIAMTYVDYGASLEEPVVLPKAIEELFAHSTLNFTVDSSDEDKDPESSRFGLPFYYKLRRNNIGGLQTRLHYSRVIHSATRLLDHPYKGMSVLETVYDDLTVLRNIRWGLGQTIFRYGGGFPDVTVKGAKKPQLDALENSQQFRALQARTYFLHNDDVTLDFKGVAGRALDPEPYYLPVLESIAAGSICNLKKCVCECWSCEYKLRCEKGFKKCLLKKEGVYEIPEAFTFFEAAICIIDKKIQTIFETEDPVQIVGGLAFMRENEILHCFFESPGDLPFNCVNS